MKLFWKLFLLMLLPICLRAQNKYHADSLKHLLKTENEDTARVKLLLDLCRAYSYSKPDTVLVLGEQALHLSRLADFTIGEVQSLNLIGNAFGTMGNYPKALELLLKAQKKTEATGDEISLIHVLGSIGNIYTYQGDYKHAVNYHFKTLALSQDAKFKDGILFSLLSLGDIYEKSNQLDSALYYTEQGYQLSLKQTNVGFIATALVNLGNIYSKQGSDSLAMNMYQMALPKVQYLQDDLGLTELYLGMARLFQKAGRADSCLFYAKKSLATAQNGGFTSHVLLASQFLTNYYSSRNQLDSAFFYQSAAIKAKDSLFSQEKARNIQNLHYEEITRQQEIQQAKTDAQTQLKFIALLGSLLTLSIIAFLLWRNNRHKEKAQKKIEKAYTELKATQSQLIQSEKMASLGELTAGIAHEIQNPLNFVNNFSEVNKDLVEELETEINKGNFEEAKLIANNIKENESKINHHGKRANAIVKGMLQHSRTSNGVKEPADINTLADEYFRLAYHGLRAKDKSFNVTMKTDFDKTIGNVNIVPQDIGRVILNLITNAFYAVKEKNTLRQAQDDSYEPTVSISTKKSGDKIEITVTDNGDGIPKKVLDKIFQPFFTTKPTGQGTGLGLSLSYDIVKAHGGDLKVETMEGEGSEFLIRLPVN